MAARLRRELGVAVEEKEGHYGEFTVLVDGQNAIDGGALGFLGVLPPGRRVLEVVRERLAS